MLVYIWIKTTREIAYCIHFLTHHSKKGKFLNFSASNPGGINFKTFA
jgi:hypothetical protein